MKTRKKSVWITAVSTLAIVVAGWITGIAPQLSRVSVAREKLATVVSQNGENEKVLAQLKKDYQGIDSLRNTLISLQANIPKTAEISPFVSELSALASAHSVAVKSISIDDAKPYTSNAGAVDPQSGDVITNPKITPSNFVLIPVQLSLSGTYSHVLDLVYSLQTGNRLLFISNLGSTGSTSSDGGGKVDATVGGYIYVLLSA